MKKNDVFTFTAPNGAEVTGVCLDITHSYQCGENTWYYEYLCYAQNRLFIGASYIVYEEDNYKELDFTQERVVVDYAVLPDYDNMIELQQAMDYPTWEQNMEKPDPDEDEDNFWDSCAEEHNKQEDV